MRISQKIYLGFALVILFATIDLVVNYQLSNEVIRNMEFLTHSEAIIRNSSRLHKNMIQMQSGLRGYLLAEEESFLDSYYAGLKETPSLFKEQNALVQSDPEQKQKLDSIALLHKNWMDYANDLIAAKKASLQTEQGKLLYQDMFEKRQKKGVGQQINDNIAVKFREFDQQEYHTRRNRITLLENSIRHTNVTSVSLAVIYVTIAIITAFFVVRTITERIFSMVSLAEKISQGSFTVIEDKMNDELTQLSRSLNIMSQKLDKTFSALAKKNRELDQFAYVVSHDLKAPLRGMYNILIWIEEDLNQELSDQLRKYHERIKGRIIRLENLINGLLQYARIGRRPETVETVRVGQLIQELSETLLPAHFKVVMENSMPVLNTERIYLEQVFTNLISNAVKYHNRETGTIRISCEDSENEYRFTVRDDGTGIAPEYHQKIFNIFQTLREKNEAESTGIGLAIVKKIIEEQNGKITVESEPGRGSSFYFTWPKRAHSET